MEIATPHLLLREYRDEDWEDVLAYQSDPRYLRYYAWTGRTAPEVRTFLGQFLEQQREHPRTKYQLAITLLPDPRVVGSCGIRLSAPGAHEGEIGYEVAPRHWGRGFGTEAARAMVRFGFAELGLHRISSWCVADNLASARVLEKVGMRLEGRLRHKERYKGRWWDTLLYAILEDEWRVPSGPHQAPDA